MDYALALLGLCFVLLASPIFIPLFLASWVVHKSFPIFTQSRIGKDGHIFTIYKLKTMLDATNPHTGELLTADERTTRLGLLLRKSKLDELPQIINVLKGDMSFVGPRPLIPDNETAHDPIRQTVKPGITGLQQITGGNQLSYETRLELDHKYVRRQSLRYDVKLLFSTPGAILKQRSEPHFNTDLIVNDNIRQTPLKNAEKLRA